MTHMNGKKWPGLDPVYQPLASERSLTWSEHAVMWGVLTVFGLLLATGMGWL